MTPKIALHRKLIFAPKFLETVHDRSNNLGIFRMFTPKRLNRKSSALGLRSPATPLRGGTPGTPSRLESSTVPIKIFELLKSEIECDILPGGFGLAIHNEFIYIWKLKNKLNLCSLPVPAGYTCKPQNVTVVGSSLCYISSKLEWEDFGQMLKSLLYGLNLKEIGTKKIEKIFLELIFLKNILEAIQSYFGSR